MSGYDKKYNRNTSLNLMSKRLDAFYRQSGEEQEGSKISSILDPALVGIDNQKALLEYSGGTSQQDRMILDKRKTLERVVRYSYQGAKIKNIIGDEQIYRALINPNKNKVDYDDKVLSVGYESGFKVGDVFEWLGTKTYWLIYLQDLTELAYFRGDIRRCSYQISWEDEDGLHSTFAAVRGPVETKIDYIQKHSISVDNPNHSLHLLMPLNDETYDYFRRYSKFYLSDKSKVCWRVEATDWISTPGILEITAVEYYANEIEDDIKNGIVGKLITKPINPNTEAEEKTIVGETFIKPKVTYNYQYKGPKLPSNTKWKLDKKYPVDVTVDPNDRTKITIKCNHTLSGQMLLSYGPYEKTIVVESLY